MPARKPNPRPPKRSPLQPAPHRFLPYRLVAAYLTCPRCEQPTNNGMNPYRLGVVPTVGEVITCDCGAPLRLAVLEVEIKWRREVTKL